MLRPLRDRVVIKPSKEAEVTAGGIVLPDTAKKKPQEGEVIAIGNGRVLEDGTRVPMNVKVGDCVVYSKYAGTELKVGGDEFLILDEDSIYAVKE